MALAPPSQKFRRRFSLQYAHHGSQQLYSKGSGLVITPRLVLVAPLGLFAWMVPWPVPSAQERLQSCEAFDVNGVAVGDGGAIRFQRVIGACSRPEGGYPLRAIYGTTICGLVRNQGKSRKAIEVVCRNPRFLMASPTKEEQFVTRACPGTVSILRVLRLVVCHRLGETLQSDRDM